ncbi:MAG TPA: nitroreductase [Pilimelia sp.]|nr:nitroreductase [Pilimelia sp.]
MSGSSGAAAAPALEQAAHAARHAPSVHNTQPWRWTLRRRTAELQLRVEPGRQLRAADPDGRLMLLSCGAALHHARVALDAEGWRYEVARTAGRQPGDAGADGSLVPDPAQPVAVLRAVDRGPADPAAMRRFQATLLRRTDRRTVTDEPVAPAALAAVVAAALAEGAGLHVLRPAEVVDLAVAVERAELAEAADERQRAELAAWVGGARPAGTGVPASAIPAEAPRTTVPERDFGVAGTLPAGEGHDARATYAVLYGDGDEAGDWLRAGEALSAAWLAATEHGVTLLPFSAPIEVPFTREALRRALSGVGHPHLAVRLGRADPDHAGPPRTPRLPAEQVVEIVD